MIGYKQIMANEEITQLIKASDAYLTKIGYTEHGLRHCTTVSNRAAYILQELGFDEKTIELAKIARHLHDIGNVVNRVDHAHTGAILANDLLKDMDISLVDRLKIVNAIGNHDELTGEPVSDISAALILADKSDVSRQRVSNTNLSSFDIHDRVNYAVTDSKLIVDAKAKKIKLDLTIDTTICPVIDYFEIFIDRTMMSKYASKYLGLWFELIINNTNIL